MTTSLTNVHVEYTYLSTFHCQVFYNVFQGKNSPVWPVRGLQSRTPLPSHRTETRPQRLPLAGDASTNPEACWPTGDGARREAPRAAAGGWGRAGPGRAAPRSLRRAAGLLRQPGLPFVPSGSSGLLRRPGTAPAAGGKRRPRPGPVRAARLLRLAVASLLLPCGFFSLACDLWSGRLGRKGTSETWEMASPTERGSSSPSSSSLSGFVCLWPSRFGLVARLTARQASGTRVWARTVAPSVPFVTGAAPRLVLGAEHNVKFPRTARTSEDTAFNSALSPIPLTSFKNSWEVSKNPLVFLHKRWIFSSFTLAQASELFLKAELRMVIAELSALS